MKRCKDTPCNLCDVRACKMCWCKYIGKSSFIYHHNVPMLHETHNSMEFSVAVNCPHCRSILPDCRITRRNRFEADSIYHFSVVIGMINQLTGYIQSCDTSKQETIINLMYTYFITNFDIFIKHKHLTSSVLKPLTYIMTTKDSICIQNMYNIIFE